jgi:hypothetical protein
LGISTLAASINTLGHVNHFDTAMSQITLALDFGASFLRAIIAFAGFEKYLYLLSPYLCRVTQESLEQYDQSKIGTSDVTKSGWVKINGEYYAYGDLALRFKAGLQLEKRKFELALIKTLVIMGVISQLHNLPNGTSFNLAAVLPFGEFSDRELLKQILRDTLKSFRFCGVEKSFLLNKFICLPEGAGVLFQGRQEGGNFQDLNLMVLMLGYRDVSILHVNKGEMSRGESQLLGFTNFVNLVAEKTSIRDQQKLTTAICKAGQHVNSKALLPLVQNVGEQYKEYELNRIQKAIREARTQYWLMLSEWLKLQIPSDIEEVIIAGGTAQYFKPELNVMLKFTKTVWCDQLEKRIRATFPTQIKANSLEYRLADVYGIFFYLHTLTNSSDTYKER